MNLGIEEYMKEYSPVKSLSQCKRPIELLSK